MLLISIFRSPMCIAASCQGIARGFHHRLLLHVLSLAYVKNKLTEEMIFTSASYGYTHFMYYWRNLQPEGHTLLNIGASYICCQHMILKFK